MEIYNTYSTKSNAARNPRPRKASNNFLTRLSRASEGLGRDLSKIANWDVYDNRGKVPTYTRIADAFSKFRNSL